MKIYFAAPITNKLSNIDLYSKIIKYLAHYGKVLNEKIGDKNFWKKREKEDFSKRKAHDFDLELLLKSDVIVAEITKPSLGVGYEIGHGVGVLMKNLVQLPAFFQKIQN
jgi:nucleoside 2-deoxyribosyltransferase